MKKYDFDIIIDRKNTFSMKWDNALYAGRDILPMPVADMDFPIADELIDVLNHITDHRILGYSLPPESLKLAAQKKLSTDYQWNTELAWQVWIPGIVPGITAACAAFANESQGILTAVPVYHPFHLVAGWVNRPLITFPMIEDGERWVYDFMAFEEALQKGPRVFLFCNPHNPGGTVFNQAEIDQIVELCKQYDCMIISDEIHADLPLSVDTKHICIGKSANDNSISFFATSKDYNTAGLGGAFAIIPDEKIRNRFIKQTFGYFPMLSRHSIEIMLTSLTMPNDWMQSLLPYLCENHALLLDRVNAIRGLKMLPLEATYLAWIAFDPTIHGDFQKRLFAHGLHVLRGDQFLGGHFIRLNFATPKINLENAIQIIERVAHEMD